MKPVRAVAHWVACTWGHFWLWLGREPTPRRRLVSYLLIAGIAAYAAFALQASNDRTRHVVKSMELDRQATKVQNDIDKLAICDNGNNTVRQVDNLLVIAGQFDAGQRTPEQTAAAVAYFNNLRRGLSLLDCSTYIASLTAEQRRQAVATTSPPTLPRPIP